MRRTPVLGIVLYFALLFYSAQAFSATAPAGQSVTLEWRLSTDTNAVGYTVYYGGTSGNYTNKIKVGQVTSATISGLVVGATYYFAATAHDSLGQESVYSSEVSYLVPAERPIVQIRTSPAGQFILTVAGLIGHTYDIEATQDFVVWTVIGTVPEGTNDSLDFTDTNASNFPHRFYRTKETL